MKGERTTMPLKFSTHYVASEISTMLIVNAINECKKRIRDGVANAALTRWFGDQSQQWKDTATERLETMRRIINLQVITIGVMDLAEQTKGTNASALPNSATSIVPGTNTDYKGRQVLLDKSYSKLPRYLPQAGGIIDRGQYDPQRSVNQSRFETVLHELTHVILNTDDERLASGENAYGTFRASQLVGENPVQAQNNAENWGIFLEACGHFKTS
jgi:hypothetical protein